MKTTDLDSLSSKYNIDLASTRKILSRINSAQNEYKISEYSFPDPSASNIIYPYASMKYTIAESDANNRLDLLLPGIPASKFSTKSTSGTLAFSYTGLRKLGLHLLDSTIYGILNGGSATSYIDMKRNRAFCHPLFSLLKESYTAISKLCINKPKALTPAYINPDGSPGYSFIELKMRALLILMLEAEIETGKKTTIPIFELRNNNSSRQLDQAYQTFRDSPILNELINHTGFDITHIRSANQPLIAAFTHKDEGFPRKIYTQAYGKEDSLLALPGGHGQNFIVLQDIYRHYYEQNYSYTYLVNVDNLGNIPNPVHIALTALAGTEGSFEFAKKTPVDVKGGILVKNSEGHLVCADIGAAIETEAVSQAEKNGSEILFNCATGLFSLQYLASNIDYISSNIPIRISEQNKDSGKYAQAEQITWEILGLINHPLIISVSKQKRFLAAKLLSEMLITSQADILTPKLMSHNKSYEDFCILSCEMQSGLYTLLETVYGLQQKGGIWQPIPVEELIRLKVKLSK